MSLFGGQRDINLFHTINRELLGNIIEQKIGYYKINLDKTDSNIYGESTEKFYNPPVLFNCLIERGDTNTTDDDFGPDTTRDAVFMFLRLDLEESGIYPENGDIILWNENYYEAHNINENQYFVGKIPEYSLADSTNNFGSSFSIIVPTHYTRLERLNIVRDRL